MSSNSNSTRTDKRKLTLPQILADPKNKQVSSRFFNFAFLMFLVPIGVLVLILQLRLMSVQSAGILAVVLVNVIMAMYAVGAYREEVADWKEDMSANKKN